MPILISLASFADACVAQRNLTIDSYISEEMCRIGGEALREAIARSIFSRSAIALFDGVDEIATSEARATVVSAVDSFLRDHPDLRTIVTSRPYGYIRVAGSIQHFSLNNFTDSQVASFIRQWQAANERKQHPDSPDLEAAEREGKSLIDELGRNERVRELARNPLMLVIISLIRYERTRLPEERVQLYQRAVNTLMDTWNQWRTTGHEGGSAGVVLPLDRLIRVWGSIAEWTRRTKPTGVMHRAELKRRVIETLVEREFDEETPEQTAESYLEAATLRAGILEERGPGVFAFWHPTFEEFLAAVELATPTGQAVSRLLPLRDDPRWREVILLAVGYVGIVQRDGDTATALTDAIATALPGPFEPVLHPHLLLAADCVADDVGVRRNLAQNLLRQLGEIALSHPYEPLTSGFARLAESLPRLRPNTELVPTLALVASESRSWMCRMEATRLLVNCGQESDLAARAIAERLKDSDPDVRAHAAIGLIRSGDISSDALGAFSHVVDGDLFARAQTAVEDLVRNASKNGLAAGASKGLASSDPGDQITAAIIAFRLGDREGALAALRSGLAKGSIVDALAASRYLNHMGEFDDSARERLRHLWPKVDDEDQWDDVILTLSEIDPDLATDILLDRMDVIVAPNRGKTTSFWQAETAAATSVSIPIPRDVFGAPLIVRICYERSPDRVRARLREVMERGPGGPSAAAALALLSLEEAEDLASALDTYLVDDDPEIAWRAAIMKLQRVFGFTDQTNRTAASVVDGAVLDALIRPRRPDVLNAASIFITRRSNGASDFVLSDDALGTCVALLADGGPDEMKVGVCRLLVRAGHSAECFPALLSALTNGRWETALAAAALLIGCGNWHPALERIVQPLTGHPWDVVAAFERVRNDEELLPGDAEVLSGATGVRAGDDAEALACREWLFSLIRSHAGVTDEVQPGL